MAHDSKWDEMIAQEEYLFPLEIGEMSQLVSEGYFVNCKFGVGGAALVWRKGETMPPAVKRLGFMRGALNENMDGAGI